MKELVQELAELQEARRAAEEAREHNTHIIAKREEVDAAKRRLAMAENALADESAYYDGAIAGLNQDVDDISMQIIDEWDCERKTVSFPAGTLKFRTTQSFKMLDAALVLTGLLDHTSVKDVANNYIIGFNKTAVKKFMSVLELPMGAAEIERKTTVKLETVEE